MAAAAAAAGSAAAASAAAAAIEFCKSVPSARVACVWPTGHSQVNTARKFLQAQKADIIFESSVQLEPHANILTVMALYHGEDWLSSNCYYWESPLPDGPPDPASPFPGAQWKTQLAFRGEPAAPPLHLFVFDAKLCNRIDSDKYSARSSMATAVNAPGNCCLHLTDDQAEELAKPVAAYAGTIDSGCSSSHAFHCARVLLHPASIAFLNETSQGCDLGDPAFVARFEKYAVCLASRDTADLEVYLLRAANCALRTYLFLLKHLNTCVHAGRRRGRDDFCCTGAMVTPRLHSHRNISMNISNLIYFTAISLRFHPGSWHKRTATVFAPARTRVHAWPTRQPSFTLRW